MKVTKYWQNVKPNSGDTERGSRISLTSDKWRGIKSGFVRLNAEIEYMSGSIIRQSIVKTEQIGNKEFMKNLKTRTFDKKNKMKMFIVKFLAAAVIALTSTALFAQAKLEVTVKNIKDAKGTIRVGLFTRENDFLKNAAEGKVVKASGKEVTVVFENLKPGDYALSVIHDENENGELDSNMIGIPKEGFAFGNNAMGTFGPPSFDKAKITLTKSNKQIVDLKYF